jgi:hypothetical protein
MTKSMRPWDISTMNGKRVSDDFIIPLWKDFRPTDFFFAIREGFEDHTSTIVYITPIEYFSKFHYMFGDSMPIINLLPEYLEEVHEGFYEVETLSVEKVKEDLLVRGFIHSSVFQSFTDVAVNLAGDFDEI